MRLLEYKNLLHQSLDDFYGYEEVESFMTLLGEHYLGLSRVEMALKKEYTLTKIQKSDLTIALNHLKANKPIQYILRSTEFLGLKLKLNENVLIPRPETEELVQWIIDDSKKTSSNINIFDIGTGSGCIAIALSKFIENAEVTGCDVSQEALLLAAENGRLNNIKKIYFRELDILKWPDATQTLKSFDIIVSNPPYVRELEKNQIRANVLEHEPHKALFVQNSDPLLFYRNILEFSVEKLKKDGRLYFEINEYLSDEMISLLKDYGYVSIELRQDFYGKDRMIKAIKE